MAYLKSFNTLTLQLEVSEADTNKSCTLNGQNAEEQLSIIRTQRWLGGVVSLQNISAHTLKINVQEAKKKRYSRTFYIIL